MSGEAAMTDQEMFERAREVNFAFKAEVAQVQSQISGEEWATSDYGGTANRDSFCGEGSYSFSFRRDFPAVVGSSSPWFGWHVDGGDSRGAVERLGAWFEANGWTDIEKRTYEGEIDNVAIRASKRDALVANLTVDINPGDKHDRVEIRANSVCESGDASVIFDLQMHPDGGYAETVPDAERPDAPPSFGFTEDGKRRFWPDEGD